MGKRRWERPLEDGRARARHLHERYRATRVGATMRRFGERNGNVLAAGIAYYSLASIAAGLMLLATATSTLLTSHPRWRASFYDFLGNAIPGVIDSGDAPGLISERDLTSGTLAGAVGVVSFVVLINTATRYVGGLRTGVRTMLGAASSNPLTGKARDLAALVALLVIALVGVALQVGASRAADGVVEALGWDPGGTWAVRVGAAVAGLVADALFVAVVLLVLGKAVHQARLWWLVAVAAVVMSVLRFAVTASLDGASANPILAPFAAIITLLLFVDLVNRMLLWGSAWLGTYTVTTS